MAEFGNWHTAFNHTCTRHFFFVCSCQTVVTRWPHAGCVRQGSNMRCNQIPAILVAGEELQHHERMAGWAPVGFVTAVLLCINSTPTINSL